MNNFYCTTTLNFKVCLILLLSGLFSRLHYVTGDHHEKQLYKDLLDSNYYNKLARPVLDNNESVVVYMGLILQQLLDVVRELKGKLSIAVYSIKP